MGPVPGQGHLPVQCWRKKPVHGLIAKRVIHINEAWALKLFNYLGSTTLLLRFLFHCLRDFDVHSRS